MIMFPGIKIAYLSFMKTFITFLLILHGSLALAQLNCETASQPDGSVVKQCFHKNGKVSTVETWDKNKRFGSIRAYTNRGEELFSHALRSVGGHASVSMTYFANGQVEKVDFSDAPDGGIQFYHSTTRFDEQGNQTEFYQTKYPDQLELEVPVKIADTMKPRKPLVEVNRVLEPAKKERIDFLIVNKTRSKQRVSLDRGISTSDTTFLIPAKKDLYQIIFPLDNQMKFGQNPELLLVQNADRFELIRVKEEHIDDRTLVTWYIIKK